MADESMQAEPGGGSRSRPAGLDVGTQTVGSGPLIQRQVPEGATSSVADPLDTSTLDVALRRASDGNVGAIGADLALYQPPPGPPAPIPRLSLSGFWVYLENGQVEQPGWYNARWWPRDTLRELGFWRADMEPQGLPRDPGQGPRLKVVPAETPKEYQYQYFASRPRILGLDSSPTVQPSLPLSRDEIRAKVQACMDDFRKLRLTPGPNGTEPSVPDDTFQRLRDLDVALAQMTLEHDRQVERLVQPQIQTSGPKDLDRLHLSPYAGPAPAPGNESSYLTRPFAPYTEPRHDVIHEREEYRHIMDTLSSSVLIVNPNVSSRPLPPTIDDEEADMYDNKADEISTPDETPFPRATPIRFPHHSNSGLRPSPAYFSERFLAPERDPRGPQGLGPYYYHHAEYVNFGLPVLAEDGPVWLGCDQVLAERNPWPAVPAPPVQPRARRARGTDRTSYTRRRAPKKTPKLDPSLLLHGTPGQQNSPSTQPDSNTGSVRARPPRGRGSRGGRTGGTGRRGRAGRPRLQN